MSPKTPVFKPRELTALLKTHGFKEISQSGSHLKMEKEGNIIIVPVHQGRDLPDGLVAAILRKAKIDLPGGRKT
jgi:predicted RNA binding protein YcfA (HicA-like mRNA interferase family)